VSDFAILAITDVLYAPSAPSNSINKIKPQKLISIIEVI
jgi:hypothetical protein